MTDFLMPSLGADMEAGTLVEWLIKPGDQVRRGDVVAVVETQKGAIEIEVFNTGVVSEIVVPVGALVPIGTVLARLADAEAPIAAADTPPRVTAQGETVPAPAAAPIRAPVLAPVLAPLGAPSVAPIPIPPAGARPRARISPAARRLATTRGIDPFGLVGTGPGGAVVLADIEAAQPSAPAAVPRRRAGFDPAAMRQAIAAAMGRSKREIPHYYLSQTVEISAALARLQAMNQDRAPPERILPAAMFLRAIAMAVAATPDLNGYWEDGRFRAGSGLHIGWAIALRGGGLVAPAIHDADRLSLDQTMAAMRDLVLRARGTGLRGSELSDATITVTSLGERGAESVLPIIYPPQVAMIGIGRVVTRPWVVGDTVAPRPIVTLTLAGDHRASDGHRGGLLLAGIERHLQEAHAL